jgi:AraC-like DNA-binding protein
MSHAANKPAFISRQVLDGDYFFLDLKTRAPTKLSIACGGLEHCSPTYDLMREGFRYFAVEFVLAGRGEYTVNGQVYPLHAGSVFAYGPGVVHRIRSTDRNGLTKYFVDFHGSLAKRLLQQSPLQQTGPLHLGRTRWVEMIFDMMIAAGSEPRHIADTQCQHLLSLLLMRLASDIQASAQDASSSYETYLHCRAYMQAHHATLQTVHEVASACHVDPAYLSRLIKRYAHEGAYHYLVRLKMQHAAELLLKEKLNIKSAAAAMGYTDVALFSKVFKRVHGVGPKGFMASINR